jgi:hypothetical protein
MFYVANTPSRKSYLILSFPICFTLLRDRPLGGFDVHSSETPHLDSFCLKISPWLAFTTPLSRVTNLFHLQPKFHFSSVIFILFPPFLPRLYTLLQLEEADALRPAQTGTFKYAHATGDDGPLQMRSISGLVFVWPPSMTTSFFVKSFKSSFPTPCSSLRSIFMSRRFHFPRFNFHFPLLQTRILSQVHK